MRVSALAVPREVPASSQIVLVKDKTFTHTLHDVVDGCLLCRLRSHSFFLFKFH